MTFLQSVFIRYGRLSAEEATLFAQPVSNAPRTHRRATISACAKFVDLILDKTARLGQDCAISSMWSWARFCECLTSLVSVRVLKKEKTVRLAQCLLNCTQKEWPRSCDGRLVLFRG